MPLEPFEGSLLKLRRARVHIQELRTSIDAYTARKPIYRTARPVPNEPGYLTGEIVVREVPPPEFAVILGDAIHNMRVSLDLLANDLVRIEGESTKNVYFPFAKSAAVLDEQIKNRNFHRAAPEAVGLLRKLAPYPGGNALLRDLHDLDIQDKHQMVIPAIGHVSSPTGGVGLPGLEAKVGPVMQHTYFAEAYGGEALMTGEEIPVVFDLIFPSFGPFDSRSVVPTLIDLAQYLFGVFQAFASLYGRQLTK